MIVDWQNDPVRENLLHVDLKRIDLTKRIASRFACRPPASPRASSCRAACSKSITREIEIECLPDEIPELFTVDVTELMIGQNLRASDIAVSGSVKLVSAPEQVIAHVVALKAEEVAPAGRRGVEGAAAAPAEPEVIKKGKKEEEAEAEAEAEKGKKKRLTGSGIRR